VALFLPTYLPWRFPYAQLRNHRKILVVDGTIGFTGGMNIREGHDSRSRSPFPIRDCHFRVEGPVVNDLRSTFADDWQFTTGEFLSGPAWFPELKSVGHGAARGIAGGPDDDFEKLRLAYLGAIACSQKSIRILTPYFVPDTDLLSALSVAALRGVQVDILVPEQNNLQLVHWAMMALLEPLMDNGCRIWLTHPPFDHTKILQVDEDWCLIGSANWDSRSLRLNFEFDLECYDKTLSGELKSLIEKIMKSSRRLQKEDLRNRSLFCKLRDGIARLASAYL
jgi:cardiolipin synthase